MISGFASSFEAKNASMSEAPSPSHSERADYAFTTIQLRLLDPCV
ncbi:hypothetical protein BTXL6_09575 [Bacillus thuringiensis]|nr:hypothetical protein BTXL6_09575 [Bacillus thuringiensis]